MILVFPRQAETPFSIPERVNDSLSPLQHQIVNSKCVEKPAGYHGRIGRPSAKKAQMSQTAAEAIAIAPP